MAGVKRKLNLVTIEKKYDAILAVERGGRSKGEIAKDFGVPGNTLSTWLKNKDKIKASFLEGNAAKKRQRTSQHPDLDDALLLWFQDARARNIPISGPILQAKAESLAKELGHTDFKCSSGYITHALQSFITRKQFASKQQTSIRDFFFR